LALFSSPTGLNLVPVRRPVQLESGKTVYRIYWTKPEVAKKLHAAHGVPSKEEISSAKGKQLSAVTKEEKQKKEQSLTSLSEAKTKTEQKSSGAKTLPAHGSAEHTTSTSESKPPPDGFKKVGEDSWNLATGWSRGFQFKGATVARVAMSSVMGINANVDLSNIAKRYRTPMVENASARAEGLLPANIDAAKKLVSASQNAYIEDTVTLYRGVSKKQADKLRSKVTPEGTVHLATDYLTSFTEDKHTAHRFATRLGREEMGMIISVKVPRKSIAMSYRVLGGRFNVEKEVVVATQGGFHIKLP
jgi:hypothetical protein